MTFKMGEFFDNISEIVTPQEAWGMIFENEEMVQELEKEYGPVHLQTIEETWTESGISSFEGFFLRSDGMVEIEEE